MLRCVIVDDSPVFIDAARNLLERQGASVVGVAVTSDDALRQIAELQPDVTLLDVNLAEESGFDVARRLHQEAGIEPKRMILISTRAAEEYVDLMPETPVAGFISKATLSVDAIRRLMASTT